MTAARLAQIAESSWVTLGGPDQLMGTHVVWSPVRFIEQLKEEAKSEEALEEAERGITSR